VVARVSNRPARPIWSSSGSTTSASPQASIAAIRSTAPPPKPPCDSGTAIALRPISASRAQTVSLKPPADWTMALRFSKL